MHLNNLKCSLGCIVDKDQHHIFENCVALKPYQHNNLHDCMFEDSDKQKDAISVFLLIEQRRQDIFQCAEHNL